MPPLLGRAFPPDFKGTPPRIGGREVRLWEWWQENFAASWDRVYFDVKVGHGDVPEPGTPSNLARAWNEITRFRIDTVAESPSEWLLIEFRMEAGPGALGSVQMYKTLWLADPPDERPVRALIVSDRSTVDLAAVAALGGTAMIIADI